MARREDPALVAARAALRERQGAQQNALTGYFACRSRRDALEAAFTELAADEIRTLGELVVFTNAHTAAALTGCSVHHAREALTAHRSSRSANGERRASGPAGRDRRDDDRASTDGPHGDR